MPLFLVLFARYGLFHRAASGATIEPPTTRNVPDSVTDWLASLRAELAAAIVQTHRVGFDLLTACAGQFPIIKDRLPSRHFLTATGKGPDWLSILWHNIH